MQSPPPFPDTAVAEALRDRWGLRVDELAYAPVGCGSWHWHARSASEGRLFVTADRVAPATVPSSATTHPRRDELEWAYGVPLALVRSGHPIARPPIPTATGRVLAGLDEHWVLSVWPWVDGRASQDGTCASPADAEAVLAVVAELHAVPPARVSTTAPRLETFRLPGTPELLRLVDEPWPAPPVGPHAAAAAALLHRQRADIHALARNYDDLVRRAPPPDDWVLTHGEPHAANVVFTDGGPVLIDWDTTKVAPRERDLWMIAADGFDVGDANPDLLQLYRAQWDLGELHDYARRFADPQDDGPAGDAAWDDFAQYVARAADR